MMIKSKYCYSGTISTLLIIAFCMFNSCKKKEVVSDPPKTSGQIMFWQSVATSTKYYNNQGISFLVAFINNKDVGDFDARNNWASEPFCDASGSLTLNYNLGTASEEEVNIEIRDNNPGKILQSGKITIRNGNCVKFEIK